MTQRMPPARRLSRALPTLGLCVGLHAGAVLPTAAQVPSALEQVSVASPEVLARNKRNVLAFYDLAFRQSKPREAVERYVGATYVEHSPEVPDGKDGLVWHFERLARDYPDKKIVVKRVFAEGNHVVVHAWSELPVWLGSTQRAGIDIFRLDDSGRIVEHWNVLQTVPRSSTNLNSMF